MNRQLWYSYARSFKQTGVRAEDLNIWSAGLSSPAHKYENCMYVFYGMLCLSWLARRLSSRSITLHNTSLHKLVGALIIKSCIHTDSTRKTDIILHSIYLPSLKLYLSFISPKQIFKFILEENKCHEDSSLNWVLGYLVILFHLLGY